MHRRPWINWAAFGISVTNLLKWGIFITEMVGMDFLVLFSTWFLLNYVSFSYQFLSPLSVVKHLILDQVYSVFQLEVIPPFYFFHPQQQPGCNWIPSLPCILSF